jgi:hypothetical protein
MYIRMYVYVYVYVYIGALNAVSIRHVPKEAGGSWGLAGVVSMCVCMCVCNLCLPPPQGVYACMEFVKYLCVCNLCLPFPKGCMHVWNLCYMCVCMYVCNLCLPPPKIAGGSWGVAGVVNTNSEK